MGASVDAHLRVTPSEGRWRWDMYSPNPISHGLFEQPVLLLGGCEFFSTSILLFGPCKVVPELGESLWPDDTSTGIGKLGWACIKATDSVCYKANKYLLNK